MDDLARTLIVFGLLIAGLGVLILMRRMMPWLGNLPGDIYIQRDGFSFYFPLGTCILLSLVLSLLMSLFRR